MKKEISGKRKTLRKVLWGAAAVIVLLAAVIVGMCLIVERPAVHTVEEYQEMYPDTVITEGEDGGVEILPESGNDRSTGIIFYVGAQIRPAAYIPPLAPLAEQGYSCFIPSITCNMAALEPNAADQIIREHPEITSWVLAGHSMGGLVAAGYANDHRNEVDGLIMAAAYTGSDMSDADLPTLAILGDTDGVMNKSLYDKRMGWNPKDFEEHVIIGANHAQFGDYGKQPRDNDAVIPAEEQWKQIAEIMLNWLDRHGIG